MKFRSLLLLAAFSGSIAPSIAQGDDGGGEDHPLTQFWTGAKPWSPGPGGGYGVTSTTLYYGGDIDGRAALSDERSNYRGRSAVYDNFTVGGEGWRVSSVFGNMLFNYQSYGADFEIRKGMSRGNGGTLVASGRELAAEQTPTGRTWQGWTEYTVRISNLDILLAPGEYWLSVRSVTYSCGGGWLSSYAGTTSGLNGIGGPLGDGLSFFDSRSRIFVPTEDMLGSGTWDFSYGIAGAPVPEPATVSMLGGLLLVALRRGRKVSASASIRG